MPNPTERHWSEHPDVRGGFVDYYLWRLLAAVAFMVVYVVVGNALWCRDGDCIRIDVLPVAAAAFGIAIWRAEAARRRRS